MSLTDRQQRFASEYCVDWNATQAAIRAGYSKKTARQEGSRLLTNVYILDAIRARKEQIEAECELRIMGKFEVLQRLSDIATADMGDLLGRDDNGNITDDIASLSLKRAKELGKSHLVKRIESTTTTTAGDGFESTTTTVRAEMYSAHDALRDLGKYHKLFTEKIEASGKDGAPLTIKVVYEDKHASS